MWAELGPTYMGCFLLIDMVKTYSGHVQVEYKLTLVVLLSKN